MMVLAATVYGHKLGGLFQRQWDELSASSAKLKEQERRLAAQNLQLDAALNTMAQGLAMFDAEQRLLLCNGRLAELYGVAPNGLKAGTPLRQILSLSLAQTPGSGRDPSALIETILARLPRGKAIGPYTSELSDGRHLAVALEPITNGGWVTTHQDITERRSEATISYWPRTMRSRACPIARCLASNWRRRCVRHDPAPWWPSTSSISITSSTSTTRWAMPPATGC